MRVMLPRNVVHRQAKLSGSFNSRQLETNVLENQQETKKSGRASKNEDPRTRLVWYNTPSVASHSKEKCLPLILAAFYATNTEKNVHLFTSHRLSRYVLYIFRTDHGGLMVSALDWTLRLSIGPRSSPARGHWCCFLAFGQDTFHLSPPRNTTKSYLRLHAV